MKWEDGQEFDRRYNFGCYQELDESDWSLIRETIEEENI